MTTSIAGMSGHILTIFTKCTYFDHISALFLGIAAIIPNSQFLKTGQYHFDQIRSINVASMDSEKS